MRKIAKKMTLYIGAPLMLAAPMITVVSCDKFEQSATGRQYEEILDREIKKYDGLEFNVPEGSPQVRVLRNEVIDENFFTADRIPGLFVSVGLPVHDVDDLTRSFSIKYDEDGTMNVTVTLSMPYTLPRTATFKILGFKSEFEATYEEYIDTLKNTSFAAGRTNDAPQLGPISFRDLNTQISTAGTRLPKSPKGVTTAYEVIDRGKDNSWITLRIHVWKGDYEVSLEKGNRVLPEKAEDEVIDIKINNFASNLGPKLTAIFEYFKGLPSYLYLRDHGGADWINKNIKNYLDLATSYGEDAITYMLNTIFPYSNGDIGWVEGFDKNAHLMELRVFDDNSTHGSIEVQNLNNLGSEDSNVIKYGSQYYDSLPAGLNAWRDGVVGQKTADILPFDSIPQEFAKFSSGGAYASRNTANPPTGVTFMERYTLGASQNGAAEDNTYSSGGQWNKDHIAQWLWEIENEFYLANEWAKTHGDNDGMIKTNGSALITPSSPDYYISGDIYDFYDYLVDENKITVTAPAAP